MTKKQQVIDTVSGVPSSPIPSGFWLHFADGHRTGDAAVAAQSDFFEKTDVDIVKVMNEHLYPSPGVFSDASGWDAVAPLTFDAAGVRDQLDIVKRTVDLFGDSAVVLATVHGLIASLHHARRGGDLYEEERHLLAEHLRENPAGLLAAADRITDALCMIAQGSLEAGAQGIYYAALGAERSLFTADEFEEHIAPREVRILEAAAGRSGFNVLHICKEDIDLPRYEVYPADVVSWATHKNQVSLQDGRSIFPGRTVLGGLDNFADTLLTGSPDEITAAVDATLDATTDLDRLIFGSDCTLATNTPYENIRTAVHAARSYRTRTGR